MDNIIISLNVVLPLFIIMVLGYLLKKYEVYDIKSLKVFNNVVFKVFLPLHLFNSIYKTNLNEVFDKRFIIFIVGMIIALFSLLIILIPKIEKDNKKIGVIIQGLFRTNFVIMGLPIATSIFGESEIGTVAIVIAFVIPVFNILAVISLELFRSSKINYLNIIKEILKNPLIIGAMAGILVLKFQVALPNFLKITINDLSKVATPLAILLLGGSFEFCSVKKYFRLTMGIIVLKLIFLPLMFVALGVIAGFTGIKLLIIYIIFGAPTAVSSFNMAQQMGGDSDLAGQIVVFTTSASIVTIFLGILTMKNLGLI